VREIRIEGAETAESLEAAMAIRHEVFVKEQGIPAALDNDGEDAAARHVLAFSGDRPVATGRVTISPSGEAVLARIAVRSGHRGLGLGRRVVRELETLAAAAGARVFRLHPHHYLEGFYEELGYRKIAEGGSVGGHRLIVMAKAGEAG
jgi:predicted GNAT family N-acyltransferase